MDDGFGVHGRTYVIVGGTTGLGLSAARCLVANGARVALCGRSEGSVSRALAEFDEDHVCGSPADASEPGTVTELIELACARFGELHGLYHVAGGSGRAQGDGPLHEMSDEGWEYALRQNLTGVMHSNRAAVRRFREQGKGGAILNMGSVLGFSPSPQHFASHAYAAAKAGIEGLSKSLAACYAPDNIRINVVAPALVETPMSERAREDAAIMEFVRRKQPLDGGRIGVPEDLDTAVLFLLGSGARFVTGQVVHVDGGWGVTEGR
ncbi:MAG: SDR family oxidoreductase [Akkermansiaceae bacterium]|nr:SDR family oxidoreductase [Akkermansiaceae bacterium]NNM28007.1 SDR family oxidoreductase [Akkermansiaceae bacterium]